MEALALARPVVTTNVAGIPELVRDGRSGFVVPPTDGAALLEALHQVFTLPVETLDAMGRRGQEDVRARHSVATQAARLDALVQRYLAPAPDAR
jgi:glycosyltransferase involved in cell wall biosynthesis